MVSGGQVVRSGTVIWLENPGDENILFVTSVPASAAVFLFQCPYKYQGLAPTAASRGRFQGLQDHPDGVDPALVGGKMVYDCDGNGKVESCLWMRQAEGIRDDGSVRLVLTCNIDQCL